MKTYERSWKNKYVDANLEDSWLDCLNALNLFILVSICEGHSCSKHPYEKQPHINLRLKTPLLAGIHTNWVSCREAIHALVLKSPACDDTYIHASFSHEYSFPDASIRHESFGVQVMCRYLRKHAMPECWFDSWFRHAITLIEVIDLRLADILNHCEPGKY